MKILDRIAAAIIYVRERVNPTTTDTVVSSFNKTIDRLFEVSKKARKNSRYLDCKAEMLFAKASAERTEAARAETVAYRLKDLVTVS